MSEDGRHRLPIPDSLCGLCGRQATLNELQLPELRSCVKEEVDILGSPSLIVPTVFRGVKQH